MPVVSQLPQAAKDHLLASDPHALRAADLLKLKGVHPDLIRVVIAARRRTAFIVVEGLRDYGRQVQLVNEGKSKTLNSRHLTGHAVDLAPWLDKDGDGRVDADEIDWRSRSGFRAMADVVKAVAFEQKVPVEWGGDWRTFYDGPHFELSRKAYPA